MDFKLELQFTCRKIKNHFLLVVILLSTASLLEGQSSTPVPADPCNLGPFCSERSLAANPEDCTTFYDCGGGVWVLVNCPVNQLFDNVTMDCTDPEAATCQYCPPFSWTTPPPLTIEPGPCDNLTLTECNFDQKYADRSNCTNYYYCQGSGVLHHISCGPGLVFDIYVADCVASTNDFSWEDCYYRCVTPAPPTTESTQNTASATSTTSRSSTDSTAFIASTASSTSVILTASDATETTSDATETTSDATETTSDATETTSDATETTSDATETTSDATETTPDATETTPDATETTSDATETTSDANETTSDATTETTSDATEATSDKIGPNSNDEEKLIVLIVVIVVVLVIIAIIIAVCCIRNKNQNKTDSENDIHLSLCHRTYLYIISGKRSSSSSSKETKIKDKDVSLKAVVHQTKNSVTLEDTYAITKFEAEQNIYTELCKNGSSEAETTNGYARGYNL